MNDISLLRTLEKRRLRALVTVDIETAATLHADDFQLIDPAGASISKTAYLGDLASNWIHYHVFEPVSEIAIHQTGDLAVLRYQSRIQVTINGETSPPGTYWHTDVYVRRDDRWQVVWSQATNILT
ncbi:MAG TPA: nuclear transport factor 2 family protein [Thermomicrobiales bacterium]|nr:nuclear transport factor 2 family protein [Thermomicrobiales bacterium]